MSYPNLSPFVRDALAQVVAGSLVANPLARILLKNSEAWRGGEKFKQPIKYKANGTFRTFRGLDTLDRSRQDTVVNMEFDYKNAAVSINMAADEMAIAKSDTSITDKVKAKIEEAGLDLEQSLGTVFYGAGAGNDFEGLGNIIDDGTTAATIGGLSRTTYTALKAIVEASGGTLTAQLMSDVWNQVSDAGIQPDYLFADSTVASLVEKILATVNQHLSLGKGVGDYHMGATSMHYKGAPVLIDKSATSGSLFFVNSKNIRFVRVAPLTEQGEVAIGVKITEFDQVPEGDMANLGFVYAPMQRSFNQQAYSGDILLRGNVVPKDPGRHGKITGITTA